MEIICKTCGARLNVPLDILPATGVAQAKCPRCATRVSISREVKVVPPLVVPPLVVPPLMSSAEVMEPFEEGVLRVLLLHDDPVAAGNVAGGLQPLGYRVTRAATVEEAVGRLKFNAYNLVILHSDFQAPSGGRAAVLTFLDSLPTATRRQTFAVLVGKELTTFDRMGAFLNSVNLTVAQDDLPDLGRVLKNSIAEHDMFYRALNRVLRGMGRA
ncbi:MAG: hypothetical protein V2A77_06265 [Pseudomonadota bacterium]